jgi:Peptidase family M1 domain
MKFQRNKYLYKLFFLFLGALCSQNCNTPAVVEVTSKSVSFDKNNVSFEKKMDSDRWQQRAEYTINVDFDHTQHQYKGKQKLVYFNNSPDALDKAFFHLYMNAFQPGSSMDVRSRTISDPDPRVTDRISKLKPNEIGYLKVKNLTLNGVPCQFEHNGTILEVKLPKSIDPLTKVVFECEFEGQVSLQIRRNGRMSREGVDYSMAQWYPKMCEYDYQGWHANPYVGREFYGIWGDFDVTINIDQKYTIGGTGVLQNPEDIGKGYNGLSTIMKPSNGKLAWHFKAENVHDFMWGADPEYKHTTLKADDGTLMHFFYIPSEKTETWERLPPIMAKAFGFISKTYGKYPYSDFAFVQGGDGGMEYAMSTLITGERPLPSLAGVAIHELIHSWYQGVLGTNEALYSWMDEGFTSFGSSYCMNYVKELGLIPNQKSEVDPMKDDVESYVRFALSGGEEQLSTHSDHFITNTAFGIGSYVKGATFLQQIKYIEGEATFNKGMLEYFNQWKFKHPNVNDFIRVHEKLSGLELDWFKESFVNTTNKIDYSVSDLIENGKKTKIFLKKVGIMPMPLDVVVTYANGTSETYNIPLDIMRGEKPNEKPAQKWKVLPDWQWTNLNYEFEVDATKDKIIKVEIDPSLRLADVERDNNVWKKE